ncbi:uncharacterized protein B0H18DRAFT_1123446 [Fomitopsis serialis]|uniref:uncharacterized protein n=1 Tax=Fomitopsis serialis TaxID=139415 RepID=UPI0020076F97|nr:uncharacterized protein B0H18DRAFT_1123446 [Neoantrodia serialis]KAH9917736.1 hypothetical protein B0H18DRAFT_1123446 [Neoantrodia serialis]
MSDNNPRPAKVWSRPSGQIGRIGGWGSSSSSAQVPLSPTTRFARLTHRLFTEAEVAQPPRRISARRGRQRPRCATAQCSARPGRAHAADDDDDDEQEGENWFAGGERSGISVQNPNRPGAVPGGSLVRDLLRRAAEAGPPQEDAGSSRSSVFTGGGHTLGSDEVDSTFIPDPSSSIPPEEETAIRHLTFWRDGFSVEDGDLMRYDDPTNAQILNEINSGRAPPHILNVSPGQPVELRVVKRLSDEFVAPPKARDVFSGEGHRLGSPVPSIAGLGAAASVDMPGSFPVTATGSVGEPSASGASVRSAESINTRFEVDQSLPTTSVQVRLADGTRMVCRMNLTHTVGDIRNFINASRPENLTRPYTIQTTFPAKVLDDNAKTVEQAGLVNAVVVQRWV